MLRNPKFLSFCFVLIFISQLFAFFPIESSQKEILLDEKASELLQHAGEHLLGRHHD